jgi:4-hydroxy-3-polyprenylbenzoate decarboxylase
MGKKIIVAVTGASGAIYAKRLLVKLLDLKDQYQECHIIYTSNAKEIWEDELGDSHDAYKFPFTVWDLNDFFAPFASGSAGFDVMIVIPCSMGTLGRIASGASDNLISRAADVILKERKRLILVTRENPFNLIHLRNMALLTEAGAVIASASPSFYSHPETIDEVVDTVVNRVLDLAGIENDGYKWQK